MYKYIVILENDVIANDCSSCSKANYEYKGFDNLKELILYILKDGRKITGFYKEFNRISLDKKLNIFEVEECI